MGVKMIPNYNSSIIVLLWCFLVVLPVSNSRETPLETLPSSLPSPGVETPSEALSSSEVPATSLMDSYSHLRKIDQWSVEYMVWAPDCIESVVMGINGRFPGPTIRARKGDTIRVNVTNKLHTEGVVIHWHGIQQRDTQWADGTASISQCPINPGDSFLYEYKVDKAGTFFYHGHFGMQRAAGLYGSLIVEEEESKKIQFPYDEEFNLLLSDWWHISAHEQAVLLSSNPLRWIGDPRTLLINGKGQYEGICSLSKNNCNLTDEQCGPVVLQVEKGKSYRLRVASTTSLAALVLTIQGHKMKIIEADGNYANLKGNHTVENIAIYSGESYSVVFEADQDESKNYWISLHMTARNSTTPPALAILRYSNPDSDFQLPTDSPPQPPYDWNDIEPSRNFLRNLVAADDKPPEGAADNITTIKFMNTQAVINGYKLWAINNVSLSLPVTPLLGSIRYGLDDKYMGKSSPPEDFSGPDPAVIGSGIYELQYGRTYDVILQNVKDDDSTTPSENHPWHLHGHDFWVLGYGNVPFQEANKEDWNTKNPPRRNTAVLFPGGWTAIRFTADNPGVWIFHCHIEPHLHMGMGVVFAEAVERVRDVPLRGLTCGLTEIDVNKLLLRQILD